VPMTDLDKFPDAIEAVWSSGERTIAVSGLTQLIGEQWGDFDGALVLGVQKDQHLRVLRIAEGAVVGETLLYEKEFGRIRGVMMHSDGSLYFATDNGGDDKIVRVRVVDMEDE
ncbi:MAG TPA: PQQ-dependent sugar dehydrogenase, partial [Fastidiosipila sp.]|nr:PQQ-dependent sugar dehydrogenase [Fastidiosipila sp.]